MSRKSNTFTCIGTSLFETLLFHCKKGGFKKVIVNKCITVKKIVKKKSKYNTEKETKHSQQFVIALKKETNVI